MKSYKHSSFLITLTVSITLSGTLSHAFDASKVIEKDTSASQIIQFFFKFKKDGKPEDAVQVLKYAADNGNSAAQWKLARIYQTGDGVQQNSLEAFQIFRKIAQQSVYGIKTLEGRHFVADAFVALGDYYLNGIPETAVVPDRSKARVMYTTAAMVYRHPSAQFELGRMQINNDKVFGEGPSGVRNLSLAYKKGHVGAEALLGSLIFEGVHAKHDPVRGLFMIGNAKRRASSSDIEWIKQIYDETYSLAKPNHRTEAVHQLLDASNSLQ